MRALMEVAYQVLGLDPGAEPEQLRDAYKALAREHHPDRGGDPASFRAVSPTLPVTMRPNSAV